jgi:hypothetical protein
VPRVKPFTPGAAVTGGAEPSEARNLRNPHRVRRLTVGDHARRPFAPMHDARSQRDEHLGQADLLV